MSVRISSRTPGVTHVQAASGNRYPIGETLEDVPNEDIESIKTLPDTTVRVKDEDPVGADVDDTTDNEDEEETA